MQRITNGVRVSVRHVYSHGSVPIHQQVFFSYHITIENLNDFSVQIMRRYWKIVDADGIYREVEGEGIVGQQPIIEPLQKHTYTSGCRLVSGIGKMLGYYTAINLRTNESFQIEVPEFVMVAPFKEN